MINSSVEGQLTLQSISRVETGLRGPVWPYRGHLVYHTVLNVYLFPYIFIIFDIHFCLSFYVPTCIKQISLSDISTLGYMVEIMHRRVFKSLLTRDNIKVQCPSYV